MFLVSVLSEAFYLFNILFARLDICVFQGWNLYAQREHKHTYSIQIYLRKNKTFIVLFAVLVALYSCVRVSQESQETTMEIQTGNVVRNHEKSLTELHLKWDHQNHESK